MNADHGFLELEPRILDRGFWTEYLISNSGHR